MSHVRAKLIRGELENRAREFGIDDAASDEAVERLSVWLKEHAQFLDAAVEVLLEQPANDQLMRAVAHALL